MRNLSLFFLIIVLFPLPLFAQIEMADQFRSEGKIYVVVVTIGLILAGLFFFLFWLERRLSQLENKSKN